MSAEDLSRSLIVGMEEKAASALASVSKEEFLSDAAARGIIERFQSSGFEILNHGDRIYVCAPITGVDL